MAAAVVAPDGPLPAPDGLASQTTAGSGRSVGDESRNMVLQAALRRKAEAEAKASTGCRGTAATDPEKAALLAQINQHFWQRGETAPFAVGGMDADRLRRYLAELRKVHK